MDVSKFLTISRLDDTKWFRIIDKNGAWVGDINLDYLKALVDGAINSVRLSDIFHGWGNNCE